MRVSATFYLAESSRAREVSLTLERGTLQLQGEEETYSYALQQCRVHHPIGSLPLVIELPDGSRLEIDEKDKFYQICKNEGHQQKLFLYHMENKWKYIVLFFVFFVAFGYALFAYILPMSSTIVAQLIPPSWAEKMDKVFLDQLDEHYFSPSELSSERKEEVRGYLLASSSRQPKIFFRQTKENSPNAFALAESTVVFTDQIVEELTKQELLAVYLHELGHLEHRHVLQRIVKSSSLAVVSLLVLGDMPGASESILGTGFVLLELSFSRDSEAQADSFATEALIRNSVSPHCLADAFRSLERFSSGMQTDFARYLSTHPLGKDRVQRIEARYGDRPRCGEQKPPSNNS